MESVGYIRHPDYEASEALARVLAATSTASPTIATVSTVASKLNNYSFVDSSLQSATLTSSLSGSPSQILPQFGPELNRVINIILLNFFLCF